MHKFPYKFGHISQRPTRISKNVTNGLPLRVGLLIGNGLGLEIVGGKTVPGRSETGAYVTAINYALIAHQLHGELQVGELFWLDKACYHKNINIIFYAE